MNIVKWPTDMIGLSRSYFDTDSLVAFGCTCKTFRVFTKQQKWLVQDVPANRELLARRQTSQPNFRHQILTTIANKVNRRLQNLPVSPAKKEAILALVSKPEDLNALFAQQTHLYAQLHSTLTLYENAQVTQWVGKQFDKTLAQGISSGIPAHIKQHQDAGMHILQREDIAPETEQKERKEEASSPKTNSLQRLKPQCGQPSKLDPISKDHIRLQHLFTCQSVYSFLDTRKLAAVMSLSRYHRRFFNPEDVATKTALMTEYCSRTLKCMTLANMEVGMLLTMNEKIPLKAALALRDLFLGGIQVLEAPYIREHVRGLPGRKIYLMRQLSFLPRDFQRERNSALEFFVKQNDFVVDHIDRFQKQIDAIVYAREPYVANENAPPIAVVNQEVVDVLNQGLDHPDFDLNDDDHTNFHPNA